MGYKGFRWRVFFVLLVSGAAVEARESITVGVGTGMLNAISYSDGDLAGDLAPLYKCVFDRSGVEPKYLEVPLKRGFKYLGSGEIDVLLPLAKSPVRDDIALFGGALFRADYVYVSLRSLPEINETEGLRYAVPRSFVGSEFIREDDARVSEVSDWTQLALLLEYGRIDVAVLPELMVENVFRNGETEVYQQLAGKLPISFYMSDSTQEAGVADRLMASVEQCSVDDPQNPGLAE
jgi:ABC-type amino acid transport substrate-binding protein